MKNKWRPIDSAELITSRALSGLSCHCDGKDECRWCELFGRISQLADDAYYRGVDDSLQSIHSSRDNGDTCEKGCVGSKPCEYHRGTIACNNNDVDTLLRIKNRQTP